MQSNELKDMLTELNGIEKIFQEGKTIEINSIRNGFHVLSGEVKIYIRLHGNGSFQRQFLFEMDSGSYIFGIEKQSKNVDFIIETSQETKVIEFDNQLNSKLSNEKNDIIFRANYNWLMRLNDFFHDVPNRNKKHAYITDYKEDLTEEIFIMTKSGSINIIEDLFGKWQYCSKNIDCEMFPFLLMEGRWLDPCEEEVDASFTPYSIELNADKLFLSLENSSKYLSKYISEFYKEFNESEFKRIKNKSNSLKKEFSNSLFNLSEVLSAKNDQINVSLSGKVIIDVLRNIAKNINYDVVLIDKGINYDHDIIDILKDIARFSKFRLRKILLRGNWWEKNNGSFIGFLNEDLLPVSIIYKNDKYWFHDSNDNNELKILTQEIIDQLNPFGYCMIKPFMKDSLSAIDIYKFGFQGLGIDAIKMGFLALFIQLSTMVIPIFTAKFFDEIIPQADRVQWSHLTFILIIVGICTALFNFTQGISLLRLEGMMNLTIQSATMDRLLKLPMSFFKKFTTGDLADRLLGINEIRSLISGVVMKSILSGITGVLSFILLFYYSSKLAFIACSIAIVSFMIQFILARKAVGYNRKIISIQGTISGKLFQFLNGITRLHVSATEAKAFTIWSKLFQKQKRWHFKASQVENFIAVTQATLPIIANLILFMALFFWLIPNGEMLSLGSFIAFSAAFATFLSGSLTMSMALVESLEIVPLYERIKPIFSQKVESDIKLIFPDKVKGLIEFSNLSFKYSDDSPYVLEKVNLKINPGEYVAIVGPSGSGKSTIFRLLLGFEKPESGSIYYDGQDFESLDKDILRSQIGVILQTSQLMSGTIFDNIVGSSNKYTLDDAWHAAELAGLKKDIKDMPMGMHTIVNQGGTTFSGGQRQRLMIARSIITNPRIMLFDEATSALDNHTQDIVKQSIDSINATKIVIAHRLSTIIDADRIIVIANGGIAEEGSYETLFNNNGIFSELAKRQLL